MPDRSASKRQTPILMILGSGQLDAGLAAAAGFVGSAIAVRNLAAAELGVFAILFSAFAILSQLPTQLVFSPSAILVASRPVEERFSSVGWTLRRGIAMSAGASVFVAVGALPFASAVDLSTVAALVVTAVAFSFISPIQDYIRGLLHMSERSQWAAFVSGVNLVTTVIAAVLLFQVGDLWVPFGSMAVGNSVSALVGLRGMRKQRFQTEATLRTLFLMGRFLIIVGLGGAVGSYIVTIIVGWVVGPEAIGYAEAARLVTRPVQVFGAGLAAAIGPRLVVSAASGDYGTSIRLTKLHYFSFASISAIYLLLVGFPNLWDWPSRVFPNAYVVSGLVLATIVAQGIGEFSAPPKARLLGERREAKLARVEIESQAGGLLTLPSVSSIGVFMIPLGTAVVNVIKLVRYLGYLRRPKKSI